jgi:hypothetical protein
MGGRDGLACVADHPHSETLTSNFAMSTVACAGIRASRCFSTNFASTEPPDARTPYLARYRRLVHYDCKYISSYFPMGPWSSNFFANWAVMVWRFSCKRIAGSRSGQGFGQDVLKHLQELSSRVDANHLRLPLLLVLLWQGSPQPLRRNREIAADTHPL